MSYYKPKLTYGTETWKLTKKKIYIYIYIYIYKSRIQTSRDKIFLQQNKIKKTKRDKMNHNKMRDKLLSEKLQDNLKSNGIKWTYNENE